jgi:flagellum-specific ATP synthase
MLIDALMHDIENISETIVFGSVTAVTGLLVEVDGLAGRRSIGDRCQLIRRDGVGIPAEVVGLREGRVLVMPFGSVDGLGLGSRVTCSSEGATIAPHAGWLGRVVDAFGRPLDGKGPLPAAGRPRPIRTPPPPAHSRRRIGAKMDVGVRAVNAFLTCCRGQRLGIFAGSGVGKSTLLAMMARGTDADVRVIGLIGERGREAREFVDDALGADGLARSVVVVATSDEPPLTRRLAAHTTLAVAESFREAGHDVLCLMDSVTRFATAQREIGLAVGEPPASRGYTPSVFSELPRLLERAGPGREGEGTITGLFTVLVDGDDHNEPIADAVRSILDGHIVLDRGIAERGRFPAIDIIRSVSRALPGCNSAAENAIVGRARRLLATYEEMAELIRLGAYRAGSDPAVDEAIRLYPALEAFLAQTCTEAADLEGVYAALASLVGAEPPATEAA